MSPAVRTRFSRLKLSLWERGRAQHAMILLGALLAGLAICLSWGYLIQQAGTDTLALTEAGRTGRELLRTCAIATLVAGALLCGAIAAMTARPSQRTDSDPMPASVKHPVPEGWPGDDHAAAVVRPPGARHADGSPGGQRHADPTRFRPADAGTTPQDTAPYYGFDAVPRHEYLPGAPEELHGLLRMAESATATARMLSREADELSASSLDLSTLAAGTLRSVLAVDGTAQAAHLEVAAALLSASCELAAESAGRHEVENCLIHARLTHQLVNQFLTQARKSAVSGTAGLAGHAGHAGHADDAEWLDDEPDLAQLAVDCLYVAEKTAELAAESQTHFKAAEMASRARAQALAALAGELQELAMNSASVLRMTTSQVDYGNNIAHLAGRLAMGASCLNDDLERAFGDH